MSGQSEPAASAGRYCTKAMQSAWMRWNQDRMFSEQTHISYCSLTSPLQAKKQNKKHTDNAASTHAL